MRKPIRAYWNLVRVRLALAMRRKTISHYPVLAYVEPTLLCQLRCPACPTGLRLDLRPREQMDEQVFRAVMDEVGDYLFVLIMYSWGEPLLHKRTPEMIAYAKTKKIRVELCTNLSMPLTDDYLERLVSSGLDRLIVSLDGATEATYAKYRQGGQFALVLENLRRARAIRDRIGSSTPRLVWQFLVFAHNEHEIELARSIYRDRGADELSIGPALMPNPPHDEGFAPSTLPEWNMYHPDNYVQQGTRAALRSGKPCSWLYGALVLNPNRSISPCCAVASEKNDFARYETTIRAALNAPKYQRARGLRGRQEPPPGPHTLNNGMAAELEADLICSKCPIPHLQEYPVKAAWQAAFGPSAST